MFSPRSLCAGLIVASLLLVSCGEASTVTETSMTKVIQSSDLQMDIFSSWSEVAATDLNTDLPPSHVLVYQSLQPIKGVYSKLSIIKEELLTPVTSLEYADRNILNTPKITQNYTKLQSMETTIGGERTLIHIYEGQSTALSPQLLFIQAFVVKNSTQGFTLTFSVSPTVTDTGPYLRLLQGLRFTAPATGA